MTGRLGAMPGLRPVVARRSAVLLTYLSQRPKALLPLVSAGLLLGGLSLTPVVGVALLVALLLLVLWLVYLSWPAITGPARLVRLALLGLLSWAILSRF